MAYTDLTNSWEYKRPLFRTKLDLLGENDAFLKDNGWQTSTLKLFYMASAPVGWTQNVSINDRWLRVVNGIGGVGGATGGTHAPSTAINLTHAHTLPSVGTHTHTIVGHRHDMTTTGQNMEIPVDNFRGSGNEVMFQVNTGSGTPDTDVTMASFEPISESNASSASGSHTHTISNATFSDYQPRYVDIILASKDSSSGYTDITNFFFYGQEALDTIFQDLMYDNDEFNLNRIMPNNARTMLNMAAAPQAWQKLTPLNDYGLRVVSGAGVGTGGGAAFSTSLSLSHGHSIVADGDHNHTFPHHRHDTKQLGTTTRQIETLRSYRVVGNEVLYGLSGGSSSTKLKGRTLLDGGSGNLNNSGTHSHSTSTHSGSFSFRYLDVIIIEKISGSPTYSFVDYRAEFAYKKLITYQKLNKLGRNDDHVKYHTMPSGNVMFFYQSVAPLTWVQLTTQHDRILRVVTTVGGGTGGANNVGDTFNFSHTHTTTNASHSHSTPSHTHTWETTTVNDYGGDFESRYLYKRDGTLSEGSGGYHTMAFGRKESIPSGTWGHQILTTINSAVGQTDTLSHNHGTTGAAGSSFNFAYANVIMCQKS